VVLVPEPDGSAGKVAVSNAGETRLLQRPWEATELKGPGRAPGVPTVLDEAQVRQAFGPVLAIEVPPPAHFILYFEPGTAQLTEQSKDLLATIAAAVVERQSVEVGVVGHTDTAGTKEFNYRLALERARQVGRLLEGLGVAPEVLRIDSFGEEDLLVPTADEAPEPRNRRVEVTVR
jgi:outer membrane protein OmpA-like peptidoglycan-associated protein